MALKKKRILRPDIYIMTEIKFNSHYSQDFPEPYIYVCAKEHKEA